MILLSLSLILVNVPNITSGKRHITSTIFLHFFIHGISGCPFVDIFQVDFDKFAAILTSLSPLLVQNEENEYDDPKCFWIDIPHK